MKHLVYLFVVCLCVGVICLHTGCGGDSDSSDSSVVTNTVTVTNQPGPSATGNWSGRFGTGVEYSMTLVQNGDAITGSYSTGGNAGRVSGTVSGGNISMNVSVGATVSEWSGTINSAMNRASGNFTIVAGGGGNGTWSMSR